MIQEIYYNLWGKQYPQIRKALQGSLGVPYPDRAIFDQEANTKLFMEHIQRITEALNDNKAHNKDAHTYLQTRFRWLQNLHSDYITRLNITGKIDKEQLLQHSNKWISATDQAIKATGNKELSDTMQETYTTMLKNLETDLSTYTKPQPADFSTYVYNKEHIIPLLDYLHKQIDARTGVAAFLYIQAAIEAKVIERPPYKTVASEFPNIGKRANYDTYIGSSRNFRQHQNALHTLSEDILTLLK